MAGWATPTSSKRDQRGDRREALAFALVAVPLALWMMRTALPLLMADWLAMQPRFYSAAWSSGALSWSAPQWWRQSERLRAALALTPDNAALHDYLAALDALRGRAYRHSAVLRRAYYQDAALHLQRSLALRPGNGRTWASLATARFALRAPAAVRLVAMRRALAGAPYDPQVQRVVLVLLLGDWRHAPADLRRWLLCLWRDPAAARRLRIDAAAHAAGVALHPP